MPLQVSPPGNRFFPALSPNNKFVAYISDEGGGLEVLVRPYPDVNGGRWQVPMNKGDAGEREVVWARDGHELFYLDAANRLIAVSVDTTGAALRLGAPVRLLSASYSGGRYDVSLDGTRFLMLREDPTARPPNTPIVLVTNVVESIRARSQVR